MSLVKNSEPKYYKPDISEFHVGFEYEKWSTELQEFEPQVIEKVFQINNADILLRAVGMRGIGWQIRVKHLDIQDILDLEFTLLDNLDDLGQAAFEKNEWFLVWTKDIVEIHRDEDMLFCGKVKNKSELKRVLKRVGYEHQETK